MYVRVRPTTSARHCLEVVEPRHVKLRGRGDAEPFAFSRVLPATASQSQVFQATAEKLLLDFYAFSYCHSTVRAAAVQRRARRPARPLAAAPQPPSPPPQSPTLPPPLSPLKTILS